MKRLLITIALLSGVAWAAAPAYVQSVANYPSGTSASVTIVPTTGDLLVVYSRINVISGTFTVTSSNGSDVISTDASCYVSGNGSSIRVSWISAAAAGGSRTITESAAGGGAFSGLIVAEYSGQAASPWDGGTCQFITHTLNPSALSFAGTITTTVHDDLLVGVMTATSGCGTGTDNGATPANYYSYTQRQSNVSGGNLYDSLWDSSPTLNLATAQNFALLGNGCAVDMGFLAFKSSSPQSFPYYISSVSLGVPWSYNATNYPTHYILGDTWNPVIGDDGNIYTATDDTYGWQASTGTGSNLMISTLSTDDHSTIGTLVNSMSQFGGFAATGSDSRTFKNSGCIFDGSTMYCDTDRQSANNSGTTGTCPAGTGYNGTNGQIIKSTDHGVTWTPLPPSTGNPYVSPEFAGTTFAKPWFFLGGCNSGDGCGTYAYALSPGAGLQSEDNTEVLGRVALGTDFTNSANWSWCALSGGACTWGAIGSATAIMSFNCHMSESSIMYIPHYAVYVKIEWFHGDGGSWSSSNTYWTFYEAAHPWGPWYPFNTTFNWNPSGYYMPSIFPNSVSGSTATIATAGNYNSQSLPSGYYTLWEIGATFSGSAAPSSSANQIGIFAVGP